MDQSNRVSFRVFLIAEIVCVAMLAGGFILMLSPLWFSAGLLGWWEGYSPQGDVLGLAWLSGTLLSIFLGIVIMGFAAVGGITIGISAGIVGLEASRNRPDEAAILADAIDDGEPIKKVPPVSSQKGGSS